MSEQRTYHNPVQRGFFPDPSVIRVGDDYYMVNSSFQYFPAIPISHSRDMVHWHIIGHAITNPEWLDISDIRDSHGIWAPDIEYVDGKYYIYVTLRLNADGKRDNNVMRRQLVMVSDKPEGPYSKPVCLEVDDIDPSLFVDDDGSRYDHCQGSTGSSPDGGRTGSGGSGEDRMGRHGRALLRRSPYHEKGRLLLRYRG